MMDQLKSLLKEYWADTSVRITLYILAGLVVLGVITGSVYFSKSAFLDRYLTARQKEGATFEDLKPYLVWADTKDLITMEEAKYSRFQSLDEEQKKATKASLLKADEDDGYYIISVGRRFGIFPNYRLAVKPVNLTLHTNIEQADLLLNDKMVARADSTDYSVTLEHLPMADYTASMKGIYEGNPYNVERTFDGTNTVLDLAVQFKTFVATSNLEGASLFLGDKEMGKITENKFSFTNYPIADDAEIYVKQSFADGDVESNHIAILSVENDTEVALNIEGLLTEDVAENLLISAFNQAYNYATTNVDPAKTDLATTFQEEDNNDFYKALKDSLRPKMLTDTRKASTLDISDVYLTSFSQIGKETYAIEYSALYDFYYDKSTDTSGRTQGSLYQTVGGRAILSRTQNGYLFSKTGHSVVTVLEEDNQVKKVYPVPEEFIGTWEGTLSQSKAKVKMVVSQDGKVVTTIEPIEETTTSSNSSSSTSSGATTSSQTNSTTSTIKKQTSRSLVTDFKEVSTGLFKLEVSDASALTPGANLGGYGVDYAYGVELTSSSAKMVVWQTSLGSEFDYSQPMYGVSLTKTAN